MTILVCQDCDTTVDFMQDEKVSTLYVKCGCQDKSHQQA